MDVLAICSDILYQLGLALLSALVMIPATYITISVYHLVFHTMADYKISLNDVRLKNRLSLYAAPAYLALLFTFTVHPFRFYMWALGAFERLWDDNVYYACIGALIFEGFAIMCMRILAVPLGLVKLYGWYTGRRGAKHIKTDKKQRAHGGRDQYRSRGRQPTRYK